MFTKVMFGILQIVNNERAYAYKTNIPFNRFTASWYYALFIMI